MFAGYYSHPRDVDEVIGLVGLEEKRNAQVKALSGGQKRRLDLGIALVGDPELVFLDEPTTGFDPSARRNAWDLVRSLRGLGKTVLLTTHYLDEAQQLADRVAVLRAGEIIRMGPPSELTAATTKVEIRYRSDGELVTVQTEEPTRVLYDLTSARGRRGPRARGPRGAPRDARGRLPRADGRERHARCRRRRGTRVRLFWHQLKAEQRIFWRNRESAVFIFIFPPMLFLLLGAVYDDTITLHGAEYPAAEVLLAGMIGYGAANTGFAGIAIVLVVRREYAILKRMRSTPLPAPVYIGAMLVSTLLVFTLQTITLFVLGRVLYDTSPPERIGSLALLVVIGAAVFAGMGFAAAALIRSAEGASAVVNVILLPMAFLSGAFGGRDYPAALQALANVLPLRYFIDLVRAVYLEEESAWSDPRALAVLGAWGLAGALVGARYFRWEPQAR